jgi:hypothetical protein
MITTVIVGVWFRDNGRAFHADHGNHRKRIVHRDSVSLRNRPRRRGLRRSAACGCRPAIRAFDKDCDGGAFDRVQVDREPSRHGVLARLEADLADARFGCGIPWLAGAGRQVGLRISNRSPMAVSVREPGGALTRPLRMSESEQRLGATLTSRELIGGSPLESPGGGSGWVGAGLV